MTNQSLSGNRAISNIPNKVGFICRVNPRNGKCNGTTHVFDGRDTYCHQWSKSPTLRRDKFAFFSSPPTRFCEVCKASPAFKDLRHDDFQPANEQQVLFQEK